jgi:predicted MFS family arabinose efflux permease
MAPVTLLIGWRAALLLQMVPALLLVLAMQMSRAQWDSSRDPGRPLFRAATLAPLRMLGESRAIRRLAFMSFVYSGLQLCFVSFMAVHLTSRAGFDLVLAGQALAAYQISGAVSRPIWGWLADNALSARALLVLQGLVMGAASVLAGQFADTWSALAILTVCSVAGATASGYTGIAYGEWARLGGTRRTEATGLGASLMFTGVMVLPTLFSLVVATTGNYALPYAVAGVLAAVAGLSLALGRHGVP